MISRRTRDILIVQIAIIAAMTFVLLVAFSAIN